MGLFASTRCVLGGLARPPSRSAAPAEDSSSAGAAGSVASEDLRWELIRAGAVSNSSGTRLRRARLPRKARIGDAPQTPATFAEKLAKLGARSVPARPDEE